MHLAEDRNGSCLLLMAKMGGVIGFLSMLRLYMLRCGWWRDDFRGMEQARVSKKNTARARHSEVMAGADDFSSR